MSGERLWVRQDIPQNSEVFGDDQYVFVVSPGKSEAAVYRATDGEYLGDRKCRARKRAEGNPYAYTQSLRRLRAERCTGCFRHVVCGPQRAYLGPRVAKQGTGSDCSIRGGSRMSGRNASFASGSHVDVVDQNAAGVMEPDGHFVLIDLADGHAISDVKLKVRSSFPVTDLAVTAPGRSIPCDRPGPFGEQ